MTSLDPDAAPICERWGVLAAGAVMLGPTVLFNERPARPLRIL